MPHVGFVGLALPLECKLSHLIVLGYGEGYRSCRNFGAQIMCGILTQYFSRGCWA